MASGAARDVDLQLAREGRPTLPVERFLTPAEALGEDVFAELAEFEDVVLKLDLVVAHADMVEKSIKALDSVQYSAFLKFVHRHPDEHWAGLAVSSSDDMHVCDMHVCTDVLPGSDGRELREAIMYPDLHMRLVGWWLSHAWRYVDLANTAIKSLDSWNITAAALASRALIEEVGCLFYEGEELSKRWSEAKFASADNREATVWNLLGNKIEEFNFASRGLERVFTHADPAFAAEVGELGQAKNVMTYVQKLAKRMGHDDDVAKRMGANDLENMYAILSNAAHPAFSARMAYSSDFAEHESGALRLRRLSRRPATFTTPSRDRWFTIPNVAAEVTLVVGGIGDHLLQRSLQMVDDFGLTTRSGPLTLHPYWRKLMPGRRSSDTCPCGCGKWRAAKHRWGQPAPEIRLTQ